MPSNKDIKILWGRSGNRCAKCKKILTQDAKSESANFTLGEQAHIVGEKVDSPRGESILNTEERNAYSNLLLLCPNCHTEVDKNECDWPIEKLHALKSRHELWVIETLSETIDHVKLAHDTSAASIVDAVVRLCHLSDWKGWSGCLLGPCLSLSDDILQDIIQFRQRVIGAIWPRDLEEFKSATITLSVLLHRAICLFQSNADLENNIWREIRFYKSIRNNPSYDQELREFDNWQGECYEAVYLATKAANWFCDTVRDSINPMFFIDSGKLLIHEGPFEDLSDRTRLLEFSSDEKKTYPSSLF